MDNSIMAILICDLIQRLSHGNRDILQYNAVTSLLIANNIPFDVQFKSATRRDAAGISLTIYISPTTNVVFNLDLGSGGSVASNNN